jgi:type IV fimbrial biogenesis protein FimT
MRLGSNKQTGVTLLELMVVVAIAGSLAGLATPFMSKQVAKQRINGDYRSIRDVMKIAKSGGQTDKDFSQVVVCPGTEAGCSGTTWENGFIAFGDADGSNTFSSGDVVLAVQDQLSKFTTLKVTDQNNGGATISKITLTQQGYTADFDSATAPSYLFKYCNTADTKVIKGLVYGPGGIIRMAIDTDGDGIVNYGAANLTCP